MVELEKWVLEATKRRQGASPGRRLICDGECSAYERVRVYLEETDDERA